MAWLKFFLTFAIVSLKYDDEVHLKMAISKNTTHFCNSCVGQTYDMNNLKIGYLCKVPQKYKRILFISFLVARRSSNSVLWNLVRRSVRLSARPSITKLSQDWIISFFFDIAHDDSWLWRSQIFCKKKFGDPNLDQKGHYWTRN